MSYTGLSQAGGWGPPLFWAKQLNLSQPGGQIMPTTVLRAPPDFQTLRRPCNVSKIRTLLMAHTQETQNSYTKMYGTLMRRLFYVFCILYCNLMCRK